MKAFIMPQRLAVLAACFALGACADDPAAGYPLSMHETWHYRRRWAG